jgi:NAD(P)H-dependent flavin oxidoreductase YrpB (nitropropane dioxygenase family)
MASSSVMVRPSAQFARRGAATACSSVRRQRQFQPCPALTPVAPVEPEPPQRSAEAQCRPGSLSPRTSWQFNDGAVANGDVAPSGAKVWFQTGLVEQALDAAYTGADGIIAQGSEAGGHVRATTRTIPTFEKIRAAIPSSMLVLTAGGIADGRAVAEALTHGADGVWIGTRLVASTEANAHDEYKRRIVNAVGRSTAHTTIFGAEWPGQRIHVLRNRVVNEWAGREDEIPSPPPPARMNCTGRVAAEQQRVGRGFPMVPIRAANDEYRRKR